VAAAGAAKGNRKVVAYQPSAEAERTSAKKGNPRFRVEICIARGFFCFDSIFYLTYIFYYPNLRSKESSSPAAVEQMEIYMSSVRVYSRLSAVFAALAFMVGCGGGGSAPSISVAVSPTTATMVAGATQTFTATVTNDSANAGVTWSASAGAGTITSGGVYTAPTPVPTTAATITATSKTDTTKTATATVTFTPIVVTISTTPTAIAGAGTEAITATVSNDITPSAGVTWTITSGGGTLSSVTTASVTYTAPLPVTTATAVITATSKTDATKTATITIPLTPISVGAISPATVNLGTSSTQAFTGATVANDSSHSGVTWSISPATGAGTINSSTGAYTAPTGVISSVTTVTVTATSNTDHSKTATATITLQPITIAAISPAAVSLNGGGTQTFTGAALTYDGSNSGITWSISPATGAGTIVSTTGAYTAPAVISGTSPVTVTVTATSVKDTTKTATAIITLNPIAVSFTTTTAGITLDSGQTLLLTAAVANDASALGATFAATGAGTVSPSSATGNTPATTLTATGSVASTVTVTATSIKDTTKSATTASITVNPALAFTTAPGALTAGTTNTVYLGATIAISGGTGNKTFAIASGALPTGLTINSSTGVISGTPTGTAGTATFTVKVTDSATTPASVTSGSYTITISAAPLVWVSPTTGTYTVGTPITPITLTTTGGTGAVTYTLNSGTLPAGLSISGNTLSGTPTAPTVTTGNVVTFKATDSASTPVTAISSNVTIIVNPVTLVVNTPILPVGTVGATYSYQFTHTGDTDTTVTWTMSPGTVDGLTLSSTGLLSGTPTATYGPATISVTATDTATNQQQTKTITPSLTVNNALTITTTQLPYAYTTQTYSTTLVAAGGTGPYTWSVTTGVLPAGLTLIPSSGVISGTPTGTPGTTTFTVKVTDSLTHTVTAQYSIAVYAPLTLPATNPSSLPSAIVNQPYPGSITVTGGVSPYSNWTYTGLSDGLTGAVTGGGNTLSITGTPNQTGTVTFQVSVQDSVGNSFGPITYTINVSTGSQVSGQINLQGNNCNSVSVPTITVSINTSPVQTTTTDGSGNFSFANVPNGTYTITPSITGPSSVFYPATQPVTVNGTGVNTPAFGVALGYTVSGTVAYGGPDTGQIYLALNNTCAPTNGTQGTSISALGLYTIHGVPPGTYTLNAFMDNLGKGVANASNPTVSLSSVTVPTSSAVNVTLANPGTVTLSAPKLSPVSGFNNGAILQYDPSKSSDGVEGATSYTLQWSTSSTFATGTIAGSQTFPANGTNGAWVLNNANTTTCTNCNTLTNGTSYYFRAYGTAAGVNGPYSTITPAATIGAPTGGVTVSGTVNFTGTPTGPLYVGFLDLTTQNFYAEYIPTPVSGGGYIVHVPIGSNYAFFGIIDQNNDGIIDAGDIQNTNNNNGGTVITSSTTVEDLTLPPGGAIATVLTQDNQYIQSISAGGTSQNYNLTFEVNSGSKLPVSVTLEPSTNADGANAFITPMDIATCAYNNSNCNNSNGFQISANLGSTSPTAGDTYTFDIVYSDGTPGTLTATVSAVLTSFATNLTPNCTAGCTSTSTTPTFAWTYPSNPTNYTYQFHLYEPNTIWQIPGNNSNSNGFPSSQIPMPAGLVWDTAGDSADGNSPVSIPSLATTTNYSWQITVTDINGNQATTQVNYQP
jgi:hypothetical protein